MLVRGRRRDEEKRQGRGRAIARGRRKGEKEKWQIVLETEGEKQRRSEEKKTKPWLCRQYNKNKIGTNANDSRNADSVGHDSKLGLCGNMATREKE